MADTRTLRKEVSTLQADELAALRDSYQQMMQISETDNRGWMYWAEYHGYNRNDCWHHGILGFGQQQSFNLFLPWHRAYLLYFEHTMRDRNAGATLPWWDWTSATSHSIGVPAAFSAPRANGAPNPLYQGPVPSIDNAPARKTTRYPGKPNKLPTATEVAALMKMGSFVDFTDALEDLHDRIHGWTGGLKPGTTNQGGDMGNVAIAAFDPIFWSHHCMIDRIWYLWQLQNGNASIPQVYLNKPLAPWALTVADVLDLRQLGYDYVTSGVSVSTSAGGSSSGGSSPSSDGGASDSGDALDAGSGTLTA
jgi:tyrosinase